MPSMTARPHWYSEITRDYPCFCRYEITIGFSDAIEHIKYFANYYPISRDELYAIVDLVKARRMNISQNERIIQSVTCSVFFDEELYKEYNLPFTAEFNDADLR